jgi:class 3 adenylate cyclase
MQIAAPSGGAVDRDSQPLGAVTRILLVTDLVGSSTLNDRLGDPAYLALLREHDAIIRHRLHQHDGVEFKHTGDGIGAWFFSVNAALRCAAALQHDFADRDEAARTTPLLVKIALAAGQPAVVGQDLLGLAVTVAFRVVDLAAPGEVFVTSDVAGLARGFPWSFEARGRHSLKGLREPVALLAARPSPT